MEEFSKYKVYHKVSIQDCGNATGKAPIDVRWVDINKGDDADPAYRSRLVAKEIKNDKRDEVFAATPPLEAVLLLLPEMATRRRAAPGEPGCGAAPGRRRGRIMPW